MPIVNFTVPTTLERRIVSGIKKNGFSSKAEFFRMAALRYLQELEMLGMTSDQRRSYLVKQIDKHMTRLYKGKKIPSLEEQLADI
ncbi:MAG: hypothetical protein ABH833_04045 [Parcubacteria group bacterium]